MSKINNFSDSDIMDGMGILNLLDTEYLDEFDYGSLPFNYQYESTKEEAKKVYISKPNNRYTYRSMFDVLSPN